MLPLRSLRAQLIPYSFYLRAIKYTSKFPVLSIAMPTSTSLVEKYGSKSVGDNSHQRRPFCKIYRLSSFLHLDDMLPARPFFPQVCNNENGIDETR